MASVEIKTEIAGTVWKVVANVGDSVEEDDPIVILESMKMEIPVVATDAGVVTEIRVAEGDPVEEDQTVAIVEER
jgi:acetyl-CoA carboxylase biotin carboxyl carrier protein